MIPYTMGRMIRLDFSKVLRHECDRLVVRILLVMLLLLILCIPTDREPVDADPKVVSAQLKTSWGLDGKGKLTHPCTS